MEKMPWDYHPDLSQEHLVYISALLTRVRRETLELYDEAGGDTPWGFGCRVYDRTRTLLIRESERVEWMSILDPTLHLVFQIGAVPVRFYRGLSDSPKSNTLACSFPELQQLSMVFGNEQPDLLWRIAVETNNIGDVARIVCIGTDESGNVRCSWPIPDVEVVLPRNVPQQKPSGVELPAPKIGIAQISENMKTEGNDNE